MSMLTTQIDNLRLMARLVREYDLGEISRMLREAADTIEALREKAQTAAMGRGECEVAYKELRWTCESCHESWRQESSKPNFCPNCGKVVER